MPLALWNIWAGVGAAGHGNVPCDFLLSLSPDLAKATHLPPGQQEQLSSYLWLLIQWNTGADLGSVATFIKRSERMTFPCIYPFPRTLPPRGVNIREYLSCCFVSRVALGLKFI